MAHVYITVQKCYAEIHRKIRNQYLKVCVWKGRAGWGWGWGPGELIDPPFGAFQGANVFDHSLLTDPTPGTT